MIGLTGREIYYYLFYYDQFNRKRDLLFILLVIWPGYLGLVANQNIMTGEADYLIAAEKEKGRRMKGVWFLVSH